MAADSMDNTTTVCGRCQAALSSAAPEGLCPKCIFDLALNPDEPPTANLTDSAETASIPMTPFTGTRLRYFGVYELLEEIARGGMGVVFKARQVNLNRLVALKLISSGALATDAIIKRFKAEAEAAAVLNHPNIVPIYEIGEVQGQHYFSMGLIEGQNLREYVEQHKPSPRQSAEIIIAIARAVHHAHQRGILHRDIKPSNILIDKSGTPHLTDFGLAKIAEHDSTLTHTNAILGTPSYMAPEQARGETKHVTTAADIYGLGAVLYECLTGQPPFAGGTSIETIRHVLDEDARPPSQWSQSVDRDLDTICLKCLEKDRLRRYPSAEALAEDLERWRRGEPIMGRPVSGLERLGKWIRRRPAIAGLSVATVLLMAAFAVSSTLALIRISAANKRLQVESSRTQTANEEARERLWEAYLAQARAIRYSGRAGRSFEALDVIKKATAIKTSIELRNESIAALSVADLRLMSFPELRGIEGRDSFVFDAELKRYAHGDLSGLITIKETSDHAVLKRLHATGKAVRHVHCFSRDGRYLAVQYSDDELWIWSTRDGSVSLKAQGQNAIFDSQSKQCVIAKLTGELTIYELSTFARKSHQHLPIDAAWLAFSPSGREIAVSSENHKSVLILDVDTGKIRLALEHSTMVRQIS